MRGVPIPDGVAEQMSGRRVVIGEPGDPTRTDVRPAEYVVTPSQLYPGRQCFAALVELDADDRARAAAGARLWLFLDGAEVPWSLGFNEEAPLAPQAERGHAEGCYLAQSHPTRPCRGIGTVPGVPAAVCQVHRDLPRPHAAGCTADVEHLGDSCPTRPAGEPDRSLSTEEQSTVDWWRTTLEGRTHASELFAIIDRLRERR